jgi:hypothetical protein
MNKSSSEREVVVKYALLIYMPTGAPTGTAASVLAEYLALGEEPTCVGAGQLQPVETATTIRVRDGEALTTDGPFADTKEVFGGYYIYELDDLDAAIELAARVPAARMGGSVEVRPLVER